MLNYNDKFKCHDEDWYESLPKSGRITERDMKHIIFGYAYYACTDGGYGEDYEEFSIILFDNGFLEYRQYLYGGWMKREQIYHIYPKYVKQISKIFERHKAQIDWFTNTDNDLCCDGVVNYFYFGKKWIHSYDIEESYGDIECFKRSDPEYYAEYSKCLKTEKRILKVFDEVRKVLKKAGVYLYFYDVYFGVSLKLSSLFHS